MGSFYLHKFFRGVVCNSLCKDLCLHIRALLTSPLSKLPSTPTIPAGRRLFFPRTAAFAPASTRTVPEALARIIQRAAVFLNMPFSQEKSSYFFPGKNLQDHILDFTICDQHIATCHTADLCSFYLGPHSAYTLETCRVTPITLYFRCDPFHKGQAVWHHYAFLDFCQKDRQYPKE